MVARGLFVVGQVLGLHRFVRTARRAGMASVRRVPGLPAAAAPHDSLHSKALAALHAELIPSLCAAGDRGLRSDAAP